MAQAFGLSEETANDMYWAGILHDIGKIAVPLEILTKPGPLTPEEYEQVKVHPEISWRICSGLTMMR